MNSLSLARREQVLRCLVEGCSMRATTRITGVALATVTGILRSTGYACQRFQSET